jgi:hypothetical protein
MLALVALTRRRRSACVAHLRWRLHRCGRAEVAAMRVATPVALSNVNHVA